MSKPVIAIIGGTGKEGTGLALRWADAGYKVIIGSRQAERAEATAAELNEKLGTDTIIGLENPQAAAQAEICVLTVVFKFHADAVENLKDALQGKLVVDATARVAYPQADPPGPPSAGRIAQDILGEGATVVTAFQNVPASLLKKNLGQPVASDVLVCGDDLEAVERVITLTEDAGMNGYYAGGLDHAFVVEGLTALLIKMNTYYKGHGTIRVAGINK
ncbi:NADPH-dependent F420 reductase [bacterium]|nr:NADPH-dependent F420 reductase [bacterium]MCB2179387.1 NADPH-dependent F420 reductase [bacterium]